MVVDQQNRLNRFQETDRLKEERLRSLENKISSLQETCKNVHNQPRRNSSNGPLTVNRLERFLTESPSLPRTNRSDSDVIAFYAIMSQSEVNPGAHHTLIFDDAKTNEGGAYSPNTGIFIAPRNGFYVFIWNIRMFTAEHSTELIVNKDVYGATFLRSKNGDDGSVTGTVVVHLSQGDDVFVRTHSAYAGDGDILSNIHGQPSFSGWKLN
ncbi:hypothetical protein FSP39_000813 [Pinctada imbricata]|uniref:C1q domain-containing protein n=1 Tax=Pinctada imbricata TaxID=66713 RepID=A0AA88Y6S8_PINIB|nr:hypothetical protein FSP39_000813 [Pinctada imbricata]